MGKYKKKILLCLYQQDSKYGRRKGGKIHALHRRKRFDERSAIAQGRTLERQGSKFLRILPRFDGNNQSGFVVLSCCFLQKHF